MKLRYSPTSPYVRKVLATAIELNISDQIERIVTDPWDPQSDISDDNPVGKVPALILDSGERLFESDVICEYLDSLHGGPRLFPPSHDGRWQVLRWRTLGNGIIDACVARRVEGKFHERQQQSRTWIDRQEDVIKRTVAVLEQEVEEIKKAPISIAHISIGCALGYLDLRFPEHDWRETNPALASWYAEFAQRRSMVETAPIGLTSSPRAHTDESSRSPLSKEGLE